MKKLKKITDTPEEKLVPKINGATVKEIGWGIDESGFVITLGIKKKEGKNTVK